MKKNILLLSLCATFALSANADSLGFEVGAAYWGAKASGDFSYKGDNIDLEKDLGYGDKKNTNFVWASFEHPIPIIPNIKIQHTTFDQSKSKNTNVVFDDKRYAGNVNSSIKLNQTDFILYYKVLDNWANLDLGVNAKYLNASVSMNSEDPLVPSSSKDLNYVIPMLYGKAKFDLPLTGLSIESDLSYVYYDSSKFYDLKGGLVYETSFGLGATAGYRAQKIKLNDISDVNSDINIKGFYAGLFYHF